MANKVKTKCIDCGQERLVNKRSLDRIQKGGRSGRCYVCATRLKWTDPKYREKVVAKMGGHSVSQETRQKIGDANRGRKLSEEHKQKLRNLRVGTKLSPEHRAILLKAVTGRKHTPEARRKISLAKKGKPALWFSGSRSYRWIEDRSKIKVGDRNLNDPLQKGWRKAVKDRDEWKCRIADENCSGRLEAHHILPWSEFSELRYEIKNGITLCHHHHPRKKAQVMELSPYFQELVAEVN